MKFRYRLLYFSGGFTIGIILLLFILSGKKTSCAYGPQARTLKHLRMKPRVFSDKSLVFFKTHSMDTAAIDEIFLNGKVDFSNSETRSDSCKKYVVNGNLIEKQVQVTMSFCDDKAEVLDISFQEN